MGIRRRAAGRDSVPAERDDRESVNEKIEIIETQLGLSDAWMKGRECSACYLTRANSVRQPLSGSQFVQTILASGGPVKYYFRNVK